MVSESILEAVKEYEKRFRNQEKEVFWGGAKMKNNRKVFSDKETISFLQKDNDRLVKEVNRLSKIGKNKVLYQCENSMQLFYTKDRAINCCLGWVSKVRVSEFKILWKKHFEVKQ